MESGERHISEVDVREWDGYDFEQPTRFDKLFTGIAVERPQWLVPGDRTGGGDIGSEEIFDGDCSIGLTGKYAKG